MTSQEVVGIANVSAAVFSFLGLAAAAFALLQNARATDVGSLFRISEAIFKAERDLFQSTDDSEVTANFNNYMNLLETLSASLNSRRLGRTSQRIARDRVKNDLALLHSKNSTRILIRNAIDSPNTFTEIADFYRKNKSDIDAQTIIYQKRELELNTNDF